MLIFIDGIRGDDLQRFRVGFDEVGRASRIIHVERFADEVHRTPAASAETLPPENFAGFDEAALHDARLIEEVKMIPDDLA